MSLEQAQSGIKGHPVQQVCTAQLEYEQLQWKC